MVGDLFRGDNPDPAPCANVKDDLKQASRTERIVDREARDVGYADARLTAIRSCAAQLRI
jgi:hypothetical protein